jgi:hypothetical protein
MTALNVTPAEYTLTIPQRATLRKRFTLPIDASNVEIYAQVWNSRRSQLLLDLTINWISRMTLVDGEPTCTFEVYATPVETATITKDGIWDLKVVTTPDEEENYWLRGPAIVDKGYTEDA